MLIVGLTGGSGAGKSFAASVWQELGASVLCCDTLYHSLLRENGDLCAALEKRFPGVAGEQGIDRSLLRGIVFADRQALEDLNRISHPFVTAEVRRILDDWQREGREAAVVEAIYLLEAGLGAACDVTVALCAPRELRLHRLAARDGLDKASLKARIDAQQPDAYYAALCDYTLHNTGDTPALRTQAKLLWQRIYDNRRQSS